MRPSASSAISRSVVMCGIDHTVADVRKNTVDARVELAHDGGIGESLE